MVCSLLQHNAVAVIRLQKGKGGGTCTHDLAVFSREQSAIKHQVRALRGIKGSPPTPFARTAPVPPRRLRQLCGVEQHPTHVCCQLGAQHSHRGPTP